MTCRVIINCGHDFSLNVCHKFMLECVPIHYHFLGILQLAAVEARPWDLVQVLFSILFICSHGTCLMFLLYGIF